MKYMKYFNILSLFYFTFFNSNELTASEKDSVINSLTGKWNWVRTVSPAWGSDYGPSDIGYTYYYNFFQNGQDSTMQTLSYEYYKNDTLMLSGTTTLSKIPYGGDSIWKVDSVFDFNSCFIIRNDTLITICCSCWDGSIVYYKSDSPLLVKKSSANNFLVNVFPNPVTSEIQIKHSYTVPTNFTLYNIIGKVVLEKVLFSQFENINITQLSNGLYFYTIMVNNAIISKDKIIINH